VKNLSRKFFGTDGVRGPVGGDLINPEFVLKMGWAAGRVLGQGNGTKVLIGKDTRISGYMFESALEAGLVAAGADILLLGPMPTPAIAYLTRTFHADAGIVISASHNPHHDNGIKFFSGKGLKLADDVELAIEAEMEKPLCTVSSEHLGKAKRVDDAAGRYIEYCKSTVPLTTDFRGMKVVLDCAHGATYHITPKVLSELGADVTCIGVQPDGLNINHEVGATNTAALQQAVKQQGADVGVALDGDGDRVIMVDSDGSLIDGDCILYIIAKSRLKKGRLNGAIVGTQMSNLGLELALDQLGLGFARVNVGDRYILEKLLSEGWTLGGEPSGHIICLDRSTTGDGTVAALQVLSEMQTTGQSLKDLCAGMQKFPQQLINVSLGQMDAADIMRSAKVQDAVKQVENSLGREGRILLRPSGTEPLIRVMVEGSHASEVITYADQIAAVVREAAA